MGILWTCREVWMTEKHCNCFQKEEGGMSGWTWVINQWCLHCQIWKWKCWLLSRVWLYNPMDCSLLGSSVHGISGKNTGVLSIPSSRGSSRLRYISSVQLLSHVWLCDSVNRSTLGLPVHHQLPEFTQTHVHRVGSAIQPSHPLLSPSPPVPNPSQHQSLFQWVNSSHEVAKVLEFQL